MQILNAGNIQVQGTSIGIRTVQGPPVAALTTASNATGATQQAALPSQSNNDRPLSSSSRCWVTAAAAVTRRYKQDDRQQRNSKQRQSYEPTGMFRVIGNGQLTERQTEALTPDERLRKASIDARTNR